MSRIMKLLSSVLSTALVAGCLGFVLNVVVGVAAPTEADAASVAFKFERGVSFKGNKDHPATVRAGLWKLGKNVGFCPEFGKGIANSKKLKLVSTIPGLKKSDPDNKAIIYLANQFYKTKDKQAAANVNLAIWVLKGDAKFNRWYKWSQSQAKKRGIKSATAKDYVSPARAKKVNDLIKQAREAHEWTLALKVDPKAKSGTLTVVDSKGHAVSGVTPKVSVTSGNAKITTKPGKTNGSGVSTFKFKQTDVGMVSFKATVSGPSSDKVFVTKSTAGRQRLLIGGTKLSYSATAQFERTAQYTVSSVCDSDCDGVATVTFTSTVDADDSATRFTFTAGKTVVTYDVAPGKTVSKSGTFSDGVKITGTYAFVDKVGGKVVSKTASLGTVVDEVICPPWVKLSFSGECDCDGGVGTQFKLTAPGGVRYYQVTVEKNGVAMSTTKLGRTGSTTVSVALKHGDSVSVKYVAYRNDDYKEPLREGVLYSSKLG